MPYIYIVCVCVSIFMERQGFLFSQFDVLSLSQGPDVYICKEWGPFGMESSSNSSGHFCGEWGHSGAAWPSGWSDVGCVWRAAVFSFLFLLLRIEALWFMPLFLHCSCVFLSPFSCLLPSASSITTGFLPISLSSPLLSLKHIPTLSEYYAHSSDLSGETEDNADEGKL